MRLRSEAGVNTTTDFAGAVTLTKYTAASFYLASTTETNTLIKYRKSLEIIEAKKRQEGENNQDYIMMLAIVVNSDQRDDYFMPSHIEFKDGRVMTTEQFFEFIDKVKQAPDEHCYGYDLSNKDDLAEFLHEFIKPDCRFMCLIQHHDI
ncbi:MAG: hypothetical protein ACT4OY_03050 [Alphaproteobacteria bacterium]